MARTESRLGATSSLGTTYTNLFTATGTTNCLLTVTNRTSAAANLRAYIAASGWSSGEPTSTALVVALAYDRTIDPGEVFQVSGFILASGEKLVVRSDTASSLDVSAHGVVVS